MELKFKAWDEKIEDFTVASLWNIQGLAVIKDLGTPIFQYTGLKDKNGVELYFDSDIVRFDNYEGEFYAMRHVDHGTPYFVEVEGVGFVAFAYFFKRTEGEFEIIDSLQERGK